MAQLSGLNLNLDEIQILAAAAAAHQASATQLAATQQANASQSVSNSVASISRQSHHGAGTSGHNNSSRQATPPVTPGTSNTNTPKASASSTRTPTPTQNGISVRKPKLHWYNSLFYHFINARPIRI